MYIFEILTQLVIPFFASLLLGWPICALLRRLRIFDQPNERSSHVAPTPRGGGIGILFVILTSSLWMSRVCKDHLMWVAPLVAIWVGIVSLVDDVRGLTAGIRFGTHIAGALVLIWGLGLKKAAGPIVILAEQLQLPFPLILLLMVFWIVGYTNAFNFMDGINGIAGTQAGIGAFAMAAVAGVNVGRWDSAPVMVSIAVSGAALGFLPHNFPKARMFMGDVGSAPLGMLLGFLVLWICNEHGFQLFIPLAMIHTNFILDTSVTLVRRIARGDRWLDSHREHFYQRLVRSGFSHTAVTSWEGFLLSIASIISILVARSSTTVQLVTLTYVILMWGSFFAIVEYRFWKTNQINNRSKI
jgi:UDP-N-acetylmuramyl pentapeptide phosphotransferase/UDP-N-acetylglucosamine-1-phosphate transferase